ncbi:MAG: molybdenum cofactor biosynthesis protein MoaE [Thermoplasmata archaeon]|nr:MAG: molybdenum cofactor biosynthesis protein MoaE [Thermoplasmata archaeon]
MIEIRERDFDVNEILEGLRNENVGAVVSFIGTVRGVTDNTLANQNKGLLEVKQLEYETYNKMALSKMEEIRAHALSNYDIQDMHIIHRTGTLTPKEKIVLIAVSASHRKEAFSACEYAIDELKKIVPIWKKEVTEEKEYWVGEGRTGGQ